MNHNSILEGENMGFLEFIYLFGLTTLFFQVGNYWFLNFIILGFAFLIMVIEIVKFSNKSYIKTLNSYVCFIILWLIWSLITYFWAVDAELWWRNNQYLILGTGYTILSSYLLRNKNRINKISILAFLATLAHITISIFEYFTGIYLFASNSEIIGLYRINKWPVSFFYNTNDLTTFLVFGFIVILFFDFKIIKNTNIRKWLKLIRPISLILITFIILVTQSRLNLVSISLSLIIYTFMKIKRKYYLINTLGIAILLVMGLVLINVSYSDKIVGILNSDASGSTRLALIRSGINLLESTDYLGAGSGNFEYYAKSFNAYGSGSINTMHNWWIENLTNYGLFFFVIYVFYYLKHVFKAYKFSYKYKETNLGLCFSWLVAFALSSNASSSNFQTIWLWAVNAVIFTLLINAVNEIKQRNGMI